MHSTRNFATSPSAFQNRRSPLSPAVPASEVDTDFTTEHPRAAYLAGQRLPAPVPVVTGDPFATLRPLVRAFHRDKLRAFPLLEEDGFGVGTTTWHVELSGPDLREPVKARGANLVELLVELKRKWARERRATDTTRLLEECRRLAGAGALAEGFEQALEAECAGCRYSDFAAVAARFRSAAVQVGQQQVA